MGKEGNRRGKKGRVGGERISLPKEHAEKEETQNGMLRNKVDNIKIYIKKYYTISMRNLYKIQCQIFNAFNSG